MQQDRSTGWRLGTNRIIQFRYQVIGIVMGAVLAVGRNPCGVAHPKLRELIRAEFFDYSDATTDLKGLDACFFCLGVSAGGMTEAAYTRLTHDLTLAVARTLARVRPGMTFTYVSGMGTDSTGHGRSMWARVMWL